MVLVDHTRHALDDYLQAGGGRGLERAFSAGPDAVIEEVSRSGLRGRGGAGFPTGAKWRSIRDGAGDHPVTFVCNAAEGEPATFKDRHLIRRNPYQLLEGIAVAAFAVRAPRAYVGLKEVFTTEADILTRALLDMQRADALGGLEVELALGPDHFLLGEETGLLESIQGREPLPTGVPTFVRGVGSQQPPLPTAVNNVETLANVPHIVAEGADWLRSAGTERSPGTQVVTVAGDVVREGCYEVAMGTPLRHVVEDLAGGLSGGRSLKVLVPGASHHVLTPERLDAPLSYEGMAEAGSALGAAGFAVFGDDACIVEIGRLYSRFLHVESCGQCPPCKEGAAEIEQQFELLEGGKIGAEAATDVILARCGSVMDGQKCELPTGTRHLTESLLRLFPHEFVAHERDGCPCEREVLFPKIVDHDPDLGFVYDERYYMKRPDWTFGIA